MKPCSVLEYLRLACFSKPVEDRLIYKAIRKHHLRSIIEVGVGDGSRAETMIRVARKYSLTDGVRYTGIDLFDGRPKDQPAMSLRKMHKRLSVSGAKVQLVPGDLYPALARIANSHVRTDLVVISAGLEASQLEPCWFYFPRMLHAGSHFMIQSSANRPFEMLSRLEIEKKVEMVDAKKQAARKAA